MVTELIKASAKKSVLCWLATSKDGMPNVSPKEIFAFTEDGQLLIANIASPNTVVNIQANAQVCVSFIDIFLQKGYKLKGTAEIIEKLDLHYPKLSPTLVVMTGGRFPIHSIIVIDIEKVSPILAPSYLLFPEETKEEQQIASAMRTYGVCGL